LAYSTDTSAIIHAWRFSYPPAYFPSFWQRLDGLIEAGELFATEEVLVELEKKDDDIYQWARERRETLIIPIDGGIQAVVTAILRNHPRLVDNRKNRSQADPFVIALAHIRGAIVMTNEALAGNPAKPNIPNVCAAMNISCINVLGLIQQQRWVFG